MNRMKLLREQRDLSQTAVAKLLNISRQAYNFYENGKRVPNIFMFMSIADLFNVSLDYLLNRSDIQNGSIRPSSAYSPEEIDIIKKYRALDETRQEAVRDLIDTSYARIKTQKNTKELIL